jgi:hypothetical protein
VLLVWQMVPESIDWYVLEDPSEADLSVLKTAHGAYLGSDVDHTQEVALEDLYQRLKKDAGDWYTHQVPEEGLPHLGLIDKVFTCGALL